MKSRSHNRIMYIECTTWTERADGTGPRIGRVEFSQTGRTLYYAGHTFQHRHGGTGGNYLDADTGDEYRISGCRKDGRDSPSGGGSAQIDDDAREEYWLSVRNAPTRVNERRS